MPANGEKLDVLKLFQDAISRYSELSETDPWWFIYIRQKTPEGITCDYRSLSILLGTSDETLRNSVNNRTFSSCERKFGANFNTRKYNNETFICIGNQNGKGCHTPQDQKKMIVPNWVSKLNVVKVPLQSKDCSSRESDSRGQIIEGSPKKKMRGTDRLVSHDCGTCGSFSLPSRYTPVLTTKYESMTNNLEKLQDMGNQIKCKDKTIKEEKEKQQELKIEIAKLRKEIKQQNLDFIEAQRKLVEKAMIDEQDQRLAKIGAGLEKILTSEKWEGGPASYRLYGMAMAQNPQMSIDAFSFN